MRKDFNCNEHKLYKRNYEAGGYGEHLNNIYDMERSMLYGNYKCSINEVYNQPLYIPKKWKLNKRSMVK